MQKEEGISMERSRKQRLKQVEQPRMINRTILAMIICLMGMSLVTNFFNNLFTI